MFRVRPQVSCLMILCVLCYDSGVCPMLGCYLVNTYTHRTPTHTQRPTHTSTHTLSDFMDKDPENGLQRRRPMARTRTRNKTKTKTQKIEE
jgi:hypothetical protein